VLLCVFWERRAARPPAGGPYGTISSELSQGKKPPESNLVIEKSIIHTESGRCIGAIRLEIRESAFSDVFSNVNSEINGEYFIVNASGTVMSSADKSKLFTSVGNEEYFQSRDLSQTEIYHTGSGGGTMGGL